MKKIKKIFSELHFEAFTYITFIAARYFIGETFMISKLEGKTHRNRNNKKVYERFSALLKNIYSVQDMHERHFLFLYEEFLRLSEDSEEKYIELVYRASYTRNKTYINNVRKLGCLLNLKKSAHLFMEAVSAYANEDSINYRKYFSKCAIEGAREFPVDPPPNYVSWANNFRVHGFFLKNHDVELYDQINFINKLNEISSEFDDEKCVILVSCDILFFNIFKDFFLQNLKKKNNFKVLFVIGVYESNANNRQNLIFDDYCVIFEEVVFGKTWTSLSRLIHAHELLRILKKPIFIFDIDINIYFDLNEVLNYINQNNADLLLYEQNYFLPWNKIACGAMCICPSSDSILFFEKLSRGLQKIYSENGTWTLDQAAFTQAMEDLGLESRAVVIKDFYRFFNHDILVRSMPISLGIKKTKVKGRTNIYGSEVRKC